MVKGVARSLLFGWGVVGLSVRLNAWQWALSGARALAPYIGSIWKGTFATPPENESMFPGRRVVLEHLVGDFRRCMKRPCRLGCALTHAMLTAIDAQRKTSRVLARCTLSKLEVRARKTTCTSEAK